MWKCYRCFYSYGITLALHHTKRLAEQKQASCVQQLFKSDLLSQPPHLLASASFHIPLETRQCFTFLPHRTACHIREHTHLGAMWHLFSQHWVSHVLDLIRTVQEHLGRLQDDPGTRRRNGEERWMGGVCVCVCVMRVCYRKTPRQPQDPLWVKVWFTNSVVYLLNLLLQPYQLYIHVPKIRMYDTKGWITSHALLFRNNEEECLSGRDCVKWDKTNSSALRLQKLGYKKSGSGVSSGGKENAHPQATAAGATVWVILLGNM